MLKKIVFSSIFTGFLALVSAQNCLDALLMQNNSRIDTFYCQIMSESDFYYVADNGITITAIPKEAVIEKILCIRNMTERELLRYKDLDEIFSEQLLAGNSAGTYLRRAAYSSGIATGLMITGAASMTIGLTIFKDRNEKPIWLISGGIVTATSVFFFIRAWNQIYKAGKLLDINNTTALYLSVSSDGAGLAIKF